MIGGADGLRQWRAARRERIDLVTPKIPGHHRVQCPFCLSPDITMAVTRNTNGELSAICFRAACGTKVGNPAGTALEKGKEPRYYTRPTVSPSTAHQELIEARFGLETGTVNRYSKETDRFVLPVFGRPSQRVRGYIAYSFSESPKTLTYNERPAEPFLHYASIGFNPALRISGLVVVEDWFSAEKVSQACYDRGVVGVALMGTYLSGDMAYELNSLKVPVTIAFDRDAYAKSLHYRLKYDWQVWRLDKDLKYVPEQRILEALDGHTDFIGTPDSQRNHQG